MYNRAFPKIEYYLYNYNTIDLKIELMKDEICNCEYNHGYTRFLRNKGSSLEDLVIRNMELEQRIFRVRKWKNLITYILHNLKTRDKLKYDFINLKYLKKASILDIERKLNLDFKKQKDIQGEILQYIFLVAIQKNMLREGENC